MLWKSLGKNVSQSVVKSQKLSETDVGKVLNIQRKVLENFFVPAILNTVQILLPENFERFSKFALLP